MHEPHPCSVLLPAWDARCNCFSVPPPDGGAPPPPPPPSRTPAHTHIQPPALNNAVQKEKYERINRWVLWPYWKPKRRVTLDFVRYWWTGALVTLAVIIGGSVMLGVEGVRRPAGQLRRPAAALVEERRSMLSGGRGMHAALGRIRVPLATHPTPSCSPLPTPRSSTGAWTTRQAPLCPCASLHHMTIHATL